MTEDSYSSAIIWLCIMHALWPLTCVLLVICLEKFIRYMHESSFKITGLCITHQEIGFATIQALRGIAVELKRSPCFYSIASLIQLNPNQAIYLFFSVSSCVVD
jgi:hypothetical protein